MFVPYVRPKAQGVEQSSIGFTPRITVYDDVPLEPARWEYKVLTVDTYEHSLPDEERLAELGRAGWLLVGVLNRGASGNNAFVHYYFVRQIMPVVKR